MHDAHQTMHDDVPQDDMRRAMQSRPHGRLVCGNVITMVSSIAKSRKATAANHAAVQEPLAQA